MVPNRESEFPEACNVPCSECPWRRVSAPGWLGPHSAEMWTDMAHGEVAIACHSTLPMGGDALGEDVWDEPGVRQCAGAAIYRANVCKSPRHPDIARFTADRDTVFGWVTEFQEHHVNPGGFAR
jgi:hypothetical protein